MPRVPLYCQFSLLRANFQSCGPSFHFVCQLSILWANFLFCVQICCKQQLASVTADMSAMREKLQTDAKQLFPFIFPFRVPGFHFVADFPF